ncbi:MAG: DNA repair protein RecO [Lachnospiraceae bacterium]
MKDAVSLTGIVLTSAPAGEYDKRVVILTKERGRITAFARGAKRPNSALRASTNSFAFGTFLVLENRDAYTLIQTNISNYFPELMSDFGAAYYGMYFCELADYYTRENNDETDVLKLLYQSLRALTKQSLKRELVRYIYELKLFVCAGEYPECFACRKCGNEQQLQYFSVFAGGCVCEECGKLAKDRIRIQPSTLYTLQYVISTEVEKLYTFTVSEEVLAEIRMIMDRWRGMFLDRPMKSLEILESVKDIC